MRTLLRSVTLLALIAGATPAQQPAIALTSSFFGPLQVAQLQVTGPPGSFFDVYSALDLSGVGLALVASGVLDGAGHWSLMVPLQGSFQITELWIAAIVQPPAAPPVVAGPIAAAAAAAAVVVPCVQTGMMTWNPAACHVLVSAKVCPGDVVEIVVNGVSVIASGGAPASGQVALGIGGLCPLPAGSTISATVNGAPFLGPITP